MTLPSNPIVEPSGNSFRQIHAAALRAGREAAKACVPEPMVVVGSYPDGKKRWIVPGGVCGSASIRFKGNTAWGRWAKKRGIADSAYGGGLEIWISEYGQSLERKVAHAQAYANTLGANGIFGWVSSRMD
jgi:hypothetical protein